VNSKCAHNLLVASCVSNREAVVSPQLSSNLDWFCELIRNISKSIYWSASNSEKSLRRFCVRGAYRCRCLSHFEMHSKRFRRFGQGGRSFPCRTASFGNPGGATYFKRTFTSRSSQRLCGNAWE